VIVGPMLTQGTLKDGVNHSVNIALTEGRNMTRLK
jgi:hypothetical protein